MAVAEKAALVEISRKADQRNEAIATYLEGNSAIYKGAAEGQGTIIEIEKHDVVLDEDGDCSATVIYIYISKKGESTFTESGNIGRTH
jgi:hypothetical protein